VSGERITWQQSSNKTDGARTVLRVHHAYREDIVYTPPPRFIQRIIVPPCARLTRRRLADAPCRPAPTVRPRGGE
jgi:hypothetical protein